MIFCKLCNCNRCRELNCRFQHCSKCKQEAIPQCVKESFEYYGQKFNDDMFSPEIQEILKTCNDNDD